MHLNSFDAIYGSDDLRSGSGGPDTARLALSTLRSMS
jgi:hypothetical protein